MESQNMEFVMMLVVMPVFAIAFAWTLRGIGRFMLQRRAMKAQADLQNKMLDKFGTSPELLAYLTSDTKSSALKLPTIESEGTNPYSRILGAVQTGIVLASLGTAFLFLQRLDMAGGKGFAIIGALGLALGLGFLISGSAAFFLSKSWGLIDGKKPSALDSEI